MLYTDVVSVVQRQLIELRNLKRLTRDSHSTALRLMCSGHGVFSALSTYFTSPRRLVQARTVTLQRLSSSDIT